MEWNAASVEEKISFQFKDKNLLRLALIHPSYAQQMGESDLDNQRLAWLGEMILNLIVTDYLYHNCCYLEAGKLSALRDKVVSEERLTKLWFKFGLGEIYPLLNLREERHILRQKNHNPFENACKALVGAIYIDKGFSQTKTWLTKQLIAPLLEQYLKDIKERVTPEKQLKLLGDILLKAVVADYLYRQLNLVKPEILNKIFNQLTLKEVVNSYLKKTDKDDLKLVDSEHLDLAIKSFNYFLAGVYLNSTETHKKGYFRETVSWFTENFMDDEKILVTAIELLLKNKKSQKWIIRHVLGYESIKYQEGKQRFHELMGEEIEE